jgi:hypothetical protein
MAVKKSSPDKPQTRKKSARSTTKSQAQSNGEQLVKTQSTTVIEVTVTEYDIRQRAYELYEERGCQHGFDWEDWIRAEAEVRSRQKETA